MRKILLRWAALLCALALLPAAGLADGAHALRFTMEAELHPEAYPAELRELLQGVADTLAAAKIEGVWDKGANGSSDWKVDLLMNGLEKTRTGVHISMIPTHWLIESPLLGDEKVLINGHAVSEFVVKAAFHLDLHLQYPALAAFPIATENAFRWAKWPAIKTFRTRNTTRWVKRDKILGFLRTVSDKANANSYFYYWVDSVFLGLGLSDRIHSLCDNAADWAEPLLPEKGILITVDGDTETWTLEGFKLFEKTGSAWNLHLPFLPEGGSLTASFDGENGMLTLKDEDGATLIELSLVVRGLPERLPFVGEAEVKLAAAGSEMSPVSFQWTLRGTETGYEAIQTDPQSGLTMLALRGEWAETASADPAYDETLSHQGFNILSVNDHTLPEFVRKVASPMLRGLLPVMAQVPASGYQSMITFLEDHGILNMLLPESKPEEAVTQPAAEDEDGGGEGGEGASSYIGDEDEMDDGTYWEPFTGWDDEIPLDSGEPVDNDEIDENEWDDD